MANNFAVNLVDNWHGMVIVFFFFCILQKAWEMAKQVNI